MAKSKKRKKNTSAKGKTEYKIQETTENTARLFLRIIMLLIAGVMIIGIIAMPMMSINT